MNLPPNLWGEIANPYKLKERQKTLKWSSYDSDFLPNSQNNSFKIRACKGLSAYCTIINKGELVDFQTFSVPTVWGWNTRIFIDTQR